MGQGVVSGCTQRVQTAWPSLGSAVETPWVGLICPPMHKQGEKTVLSPCMAPISGRKLYSQPRQAVAMRARAVTIASLLMGGCGLSQEGVEDGCKGTCGYLCKVWGLSPDRTGDAISLMHAVARIDLHRKIIHLVMG